jgi:pimeloyl-ACP methyl ester carboxylesterase
MTSPSSKYIRTVNLRHHLLVQGDEDGLPVLLLHGSFGSSRWWLPFLEILPSEVHIVAPDLRGCGRSDKPDSGYGISEQADDIWKLITALGWSDFDLVGHSTGGAIAAEFALEHPGALHSLVLVDSVPLEGVYSPVETLRLLDQMRENRNLLAQALAQLMPSYFPGGDDPAKQAFFDSLVDDAAAMAPAAFTGVAEAVNAWNRFEDGRHLTLPTQLIWGEIDHLVEREAMTRTLIAIPGAYNLEVIQRVGHSPMIEAPLALAELVIDFVTEDFADFDDVRASADEDGCGQDESPG